MVENGFTPGFQGEKAAVFGESCPVKHPERRWLGRTVGDPSCTCCPYHCPAPLQPTLIIKHQRRVEERAGSPRFPST